MITLPPVEVARRLLFPPLLTFERPAQGPFANPDHSGFAPSSPAPHIEPLLPNIFALLTVPWFIPSFPNEPHRTRANAMRGRVKIYRSIESK